MRKEGEGLTGAFGEGSGGEFSSFPEESSTADPQPPMQSISGGGDDRADFGDDLYFGGIIIIYS